MIKRTRTPDNNFDLAVRTVIEDIWLWRHRQPSVLAHARGRRAGSMGQEEAATRLGLSPSVYINLESGAPIMMSADNLMRLIDWAYDIAEAPPPTLAELCFLARRRSGRPLRDIAIQVGMSAAAYVAAETRGDAGIIEFWRRQGYSFPGLASLRVPPPKLVRPGAPRLVRPAA